MTQLAHLQWRAAIKEYNPEKKLSEEQVSLLIEAANLAPTSYGVQPLKLWVVSDQATKEQLKEAGYHQPAFTDASHILVFASRTNVTEEDIREYVERIMDQRGVSREDIAAYEEMMLGTVNNQSEEQSHNWAARQTYIALGMTMAEAARNKIDTTPMEGFDNDAFDELLGLTEKGYRAVVCLAAGFRSEDDMYAKMPKVRKSTKEFATFI